MTLKKAALCPDASLETLRPFCYRRTHRLQGDLCRCLHKGSLQAVQVVVALSASRDLKPSQTKPSQAKVPTGGGDLRDAQVDVPVPVSHSCV